MGSNSREKTLLSGEGSSEPGTQSSSLYNPYSCLFDNGKYVKFELWKAGFLGAHVHFGNVFVEPVLLSNHYIHFIYSKHRDNTIVNEFINLSKEPEEAIYDSNGSILPALLSSTDRRPDYGGRERKYKIYGIIIGTSNTKMFTTS